MQRIIISILLIVAFVGCNFNSFSDLPSPEPQQWETTHLISELTSSPYTITQDIVVEGVVVANDSTGNFYQEVYIEQPTKDYEQYGFHSLRLKIGYYESYLDFRLGSTIALNLKGLTVKRVEQRLEVGLQADDHTASPELIPNKQLIAKHCNKQIGQLNLTAQKLKFREITTSHIGQLVQVDSLYFEEQLGSYSSSSKIVEMGSKDKFSLYTSPYSSFADQAIPTGYFSVEAIVIQRDRELELMIISPEKISKL